MHVAVWYSDCKYTYDMLTDMFVSEQFVPGLRFSVHLFLQHKAHSVSHRQPLILWWMGWSQSQRTSGERQGTAWTSRQSIAESQHKAARWNKVVAPFMLHTQNKHTNIYNKHSVECRSSDFCVKGACGLDTGSAGQVVCHACMSVVKWKGECFFYNIVSYIDVCNTFEQYSVVSVFLKIHRIVSLYCNRASWICLIV